MNDLKRGCTNNQVTYQQLGAPALVYYQNSEYDMDASAISQGKPSSIESTHQRICRAKFLFHYPIYNVTESLSDCTQRIEDSKDPEPQEEPLETATSAQQSNTKKQQISRRLVHQNQRSDEHDHVFDAESEYRKRRTNMPLHRQRLGLLSDDFKGIDWRDEESDRFSTKRKRKVSTKTVHILEDYTTYNYPFIPGSFKGGKSDSPQVLGDRFLNSKRYAVERLFSDPAYLAPFGVSSLGDLEVKNDSIKNTMLKDTSIINQGQGNCLLVSRCPCTPCSLKSRSKASWCLIHPKGDCNDRLCVSNLITPHGAENAGHMFRTEKVSEQKDFRRLARHASTTYPNELNLGDTILEVKQAGIWDASKQKCTFVVRTVTSICVLQLATMKATTAQSILAKNYSFDDDVCWGNYVIQEIHRVDMRTLHTSSLSLYPTSLTCHPEYGNHLIGSKFAVSSRSNRGDMNVIHHYLAGDADKLHSTRHDIASLKYISMVDFSSAHPMVLWSASSSYVRPTLSTDVQFRQPQLGMGSSLFAIDLRDDSATFQWSPSAQEMVTEGFHSISSIATDWQRESTVYVSSKSAGKTWEIDARMPFRSINEWSITYGAEDTSLMRKQKGFFSDGMSLVTSVVHDTNSEGNDTYVSPCLTIDTTPGTYGLHILQRPISKVRFQVDSLESIDSRRLKFSESTSIAASSAFTLPEISSRAHPTGIAALRLPMNSFGVDASNDIGEGAADVLYTLVLTNTGDIYGYALEESRKGSPMSNDCIDSSIGTKPIRVPAEMEGRLKNLEYKHWKPTGGMNIRLYLTNACPIKPNFLVAQPKDQTSYLTIQKIATKRFKKHQERLLRRVKKAVRVDDNSAVDKFERDGSGVTISSTSAVGTDKSLLIPRALKAKAKKVITFYNETEASTEEPSNYQTSDLSSGILEMAKGLWSEDTQQGGL
ncbi:unnamed protein product [Cylindrotheca closterium]|uniref:Uncharacterized protein n=1 Tax=Cylindrotheca closterium TaxID=2856 RepID=A0AAD2CLN9_9STRA|nr:unnamed protein product [Cylindrotheca closterium]